VQDIANPLEGLGPWLLNEKTHTPKSGLNSIYQINRPITMDNPTREGNCLLQKKYAL
jgi:hypothetical protein